MEDANARFVEFLADAMKRIEAVRPDVLLQSEKSSRMLCLMLSLKKKKAPLLWEEEESGGMKRLEEIEQIRKTVNKMQGDRPFTHRQIGEKISDLISAYRDLADKMNRDRAAGLDVKEPEWEFFPNLKFLVAWMNANSLFFRVEDELCALAFSQAANQEFVNTQPATEEASPEANSQEVTSEAINEEVSPRAANQLVSPKATNQQISQEIVSKEVDPEPNSQELNLQNPSQELGSQDLSEQFSSQDLSQPQQQFPSTLAFFENIEQPVSKPEEPEEKKKEVAKSKKKAVLPENVEFTTEDNICLAKEYQKPLSIPDPEKAPEEPSQSQEDEGVSNTQTEGGAKWTFKKNLRLIREYQRHPRLWSPTYMIYSIRHSCGGGVIKRSQEIELITEEMNKFEKIPFTYSQILQQIRNLRMKYRAHFKTFLTDGKEPDWKLFKYLKFLDDTVGVADPKDVIVKQEPVKTTKSPLLQLKSNEENKENNGGRMSHIPLAQGLLGGGAQGPRKQPKISAYMLLPGQGHRTSKRTFSVSSSDSNPDDIIFTQPHDNSPPVKRGKLVSLEETEPLSKDISVLNISTGTDIWIDEPEQQQPQAQRQGKNDLDQNYGLRASTKKATLTSMINLSKKVTGNGPHSKKISEKSDKNGSRWSRIRELVAATPNNTPEQMTQDLYMVESFLSTNCTVESPDIVYERNSRRISTNTAINSSSVSENMEDANARFVEFLADAMKRIEAVRPDRVAAVRKVIKDALFDAEFEEEK
uniref:MADF domain-containing protein n=1 Tax=Ditylenchus dipsaci TaxID=166011 RepID=A0A915E4X2_9BILA